MRNYRVNRAKHIVYETLSEVPSNIKVLKDWRKGNIGDWVLADDKSVVQVLRRGGMLKKNGESAYIGTCTGTFIIHKDTFLDTDKRTNIYSFGGNSTPEQVVVNRKKMTANEELFVLYMSQGLQPQDAYVKAFPTNNKRYARMKAVNLIKTERIQTAVKEELKPILEELSIDERFVLEGIRVEAQTAEKSDTRLKALFKLSDILDLEDKSSTKIQQVTGIQFKGLTDKMIEEAERPKELPGDE